MKRYNGITSIVALVCFSFLMLTQHAIAQESVTYYHNDLLGSPVAATDDNGDVLWRRHYAPFGAEVASEGEGAEQDRKGYTGHVMDRDTGLVYMGARYFNPDIGVFYGYDPAPVVAGNPYSFSRYAYANQSPYKFVDPDGRHPILIFIAKELAGEAFEQATGIPVPSLKNLGKGVTETIAKKSLRENVTKKVLKDGDSLSTNDALDAAADHLGTGYKEIAPGVFKSADGKKLLRMTDSDLAKVNNHGGAPHMNFETGKTVVKPNGRERFVTDSGPDGNKHIFLPEEK